MKFFIEFSTIYLLLDLTALWLFTMLTIVQYPLDLPMHVWQSVTVKFFKWENQRAHYPVPFIIEFLKGTEKQSPCCEGMVATTEGGGGVAWVECHLSLGWGLNHPPVGFYLRFPWRSKSYEPTVKRFWTIVTQNKCNHCDKDLSLSRPARRVGSGDSARLDFEGLWR